MKIMSYTILHYGREWLYWALKSVMPFVEEAHVFYTHQPSHGHGTRLKNPETRDELKSIVNSIDRTVWHEHRTFQHEGFHREFAVNYLKSLGADIIMVVDADELWDPVILQESLQIIENTKGSQYLVGARHFWRSLKWVCDDQAVPTRFLVPERMYQEQPNIPHRTWYLPIHLKFFHMGYAQTPAIIQYKQDIHGHKAEWREGWFENIFLPWQPGMIDVHPTCEENYWIPTEYIANAAQTLKFLTQGNPHWNKDIIK